MGLNIDKIEYRKKLKEYCEYYIKRHAKRKIILLLSELRKNPNLLPNDFYIVDKDEFSYCVRQIIPIIGGGADMYFFIRNYESFYIKAAEEAKKYCELLLKRKNTILPNKKKFIKELNSIFNKINLEDHQKAKIYNFILKHYDIFPYDFDIVDLSKLEEGIIFSKSMGSCDDYNWKNIILLMETFNDYYMKSKEKIESNKKRDNLNDICVDFDGYIIHLKANELEELDKVDKHNPASIENIKYRYKDELKKCNILFDSISSLYDNLDDFKGIDSFIVYDAINKVTSIKEFYDIPLICLVEIFKEEFKKSKENNYTTSEIIAKFRKNASESLEKARLEQKQEAIEKYISEITKRNEQIDKRNRQKLNEHQERISIISFEINELKEKLKKKEEQLENEKKQEVKYELKFINEEMLFNWCEDHFEIKNEYINHLNEYDLSAIRWNNVKVSGTDFSITNAELDPQKVYKKDLSNCKFKDSNLRDLNIDYACVNLRGTDIREEISMPGVEHSIYDENTKFSNEIINYLTDLEKDNYNNRNINCNLKR